MHFFLGIGYGHLHGAHDVTDLLDKLQFGIYASVTGWHHIAASLSKVVRIEGTFHMSHHNKVAHVLQARQTTIIRSSPLYLFLSSLVSLFLTLTGSISTAPHNRQALNTRKMLQLNFNMSLRVCACRHLRFQNWLNTHRIRLWHWPFPIMKCFDGLVV